MPGSVRIGRDMGSLTNDSDQTGMSGQKLTVGVIVPCYQQGHLLRDAIESLLNQTRPVDQIIIVNDGSTDSTESVARGYGDRVEYVYKPNAGLAAARNTGIMHARTDLLLFLDSDDMLKPEAIEKLAGVLEGDPSLSAVYGGWMFMDSNGQPMTTHQPPALPENPIELFLPNNTIPVHCVMIRRKMLENVGLFDPMLRSTEDMDFWIRFAWAGAKFARIEDIVACYRRSPNTLTTRKDAMYATRLAVCRKVQAMAKMRGQYQSLARRSIRECRVEEIIARTMVPFYHQPGLKSLGRCLSEWLKMCTRRPIQLLYTPLALVQAAKLLARR